MERIASNRMYKGSSRRAYVFRDIRLHFFLFIQDQFSYGRLHQRTYTESFYGLQTIRRILMGETFLVSHIKVLRQPSVVEVHLSQKGARHSLKNLKRFP